MRLLYLYIQSFRCFRPEHPLEVNFTTDYCFSLADDGDGRRLVCNASDRPLPKNFFGFTGEENAVTEVSAIIGENGAGKSSLASFVQRMRMADAQKNAFLVVYENEHDKSWRCQTSMRDIVLPKHGEIIKEGYVWKKSETEGVLSIEEILKGSFDYVYFSPYYSDQQPFDLHDDPSCVNLSTSALLERRPEYVLNKAIAKDDERNLLLRSYSVEQKIWELRFAAKYVKWEASVKELIDIHSPRIVLLRPYADMEDVSISILRRESGENGPTDTSVEAVKIANNALGLIKALDNLCNDVFFGSLRAFVANYFRNLASSMRLPGYSEDVFGDQLITKLITVVIEEDVSRIDKSFRVVKALEGIKSLSSPLLDSRGREALHRFFKKVRDFCVPYWPNVLPANIPFEMEKFDNRQKELFDFIEDHFLSSPINPYVEITFNPPMSSGEASFLSMFARLYQYFSTRELCTKDVLLFLDEAETTLHPEWQQRLVLSVILFLNKVAIGCKVHVIFATHSPMLLSDIPIGNAIFLRRAFENETEREGVYAQQIFTADPSSDYTNSFGAHVVDLLGNSFFLSKGTIGCFARRKIQEAIDGKLSKEDSKLVAQMIGDPILRQVARDSV